MFKNVSQKLKTLAMVMVAIAIIPSIALVIFGLTFAGYNALMCCIAIIGAVLLFLGALCGAYFMYGFGELIENTAKLKNIANSSETPVVETEDEELPEL